jgi:hypothetical protein
MAEAKVNAGAEGDVPVRVPPKIEPLGMLVGGRIQIGSSEHGHDPVAALEPHAAKLHVLAHEARLGELHRRDEAQEFLDREIGAVPVLFEPIAEFGVLQELINRTADEMRGGLMRRPASPMSFGCFYGERRQVLGTLRYRW